MEENKENEDKKPEEIPKKSKKYRKHKDIGKLNPTQFSQNTNKEINLDMNKQLSPQETHQNNKNINYNNSNIPKSQNSISSEEPQETPKTKLENKFSFLYRIDDNNQHQTQKQVMDKEKYEVQVKKIAEFDTIEDFWGIFQHLRKPDSCKPGIEFFMFKEPIKPLWEDENNKNGGRFSIKLKRGYTTIIWEEMIFVLIGGILPKEMKDEINGIVVSSRKDFNTLQIWFKNYDSKIVDDLEQCIRDILVIPSDVILEKKQFNKSSSKKEYGNSNNNNNNKNNQSGGFYNRGYNNNNNYYDNSYGNYKEHKKNKFNSHKNRK